jgi:ankyrin repeat protein
MSSDDKDPASELLAILLDSGIDQSVAQYVYQLFQQDPSSAFEQANDVLGPWLPDKTALHGLMEKLHAKVNDTKVPDKQQTASIFACSTELTKVEQLDSKPPDQASKDSFFQAIEAGDLCEVKRVLGSLSNDGVDALVTAEDAHGENALRISIKWKRVDVLRELLLVPSVVQALGTPNRHNYTALQIATSMGLEDATSLILHCSTTHRIQLLSSTTNDQNTAFHLAGRGGHGKVFDTLVRAWSETSSDATLLNAVNCSNESALHLLAAEGKSTQVETLMKISGVDPSIQDKDGNTPIHAAALENHEDIACFLLESGKGKGVNVQNSLGLSVLHVAASNGLQKLAVCAIASGADLSSRNDECLGGCTPLHVAASYGHEAICRFMLARGADFTEANDDGFTSVQLASMGGHTKVVARLNNSRSKGQ